jgi:hypothetical protein
LNAETVEDFASEISQAWKAAQARFLMIGRYLNQAKAKLKGHYEAELLSRLPFGRQVAFQLATVAEKIDNGVLPPEAKHIPTYSTIYHLTTLTHEELEAARAERLLGETTTRRQIEDFKRRIRSRGPDRHQELRLKRDRLLAEVKRLQQQIAEIEREMTEGVIDAVASVAVASNPPAPNPTAPNPADPNPAVIR